MLRTLAIVGTLVFTIYLHIAYLDLRDFWQSRPAAGGGNAQLVGKA